MSEQAQPKSEDTRFAPNVCWTRLDEVVEPGAYVCRGTGDLVRIVAAGQPLDAEELLGEHGGAPVYVTRVSPDPFLRITQARMQAADRDVEVNF